MHLSYAIHLSTLMILAAVILDLLIGSPRWLPHPVRMISAAIDLGDRMLHTGRRRADLVLGALLSLALIVGSAAIATAVIVCVERYRSALGAAVAILIAWTTLAIRGVDRAANDIQRRLAQGDEAGARAALPALAGRDPQARSRNGVIRATVETVAESSCDAMLAPLFFLFLAGPVAAVAYRVINTLDAMIAHRTTRYLYFGRLAARIDDAANFIPARLAAAGIIIAAGLLERRIGQAFAACLSDARQHPSPNAGFPESAIAGALGFQLGGEAVYSGEVEHRPRVGRPERSPQIDDIARARRLVLVAVAIIFCVMSLARFVIRKFMVA
jgi:adenosylcobinamide-phosphate synthase